MPINIPAKAGHPYRPANGTEGMRFEAKFCEHCKHYNDGGCNIMLNAMWYDKKDDEYPKEWVFDAEGSPTCTSFERVDNV